MIVMCAGMSRSGSTVQYQVISDLVERNNAGVAMGVWNSGKKLPPKSHREFYYVYKREQAMPDQIKLVDYSFATVRHPYDVAISLYRYRLAKEYYQPGHQPKGINDIVRDEMRQVVAWRNFWRNAGAHAIRYEDVYPYGWYKVVRQAADVLSIDVTDQECKDIADEYSIHENIERARKQDRWFDYQGSMLTAAHVGPNKGVPGEGEKYLNTAQKKMIKNYALYFMEEHGYE
jgi:hypothetical protein